MKPNDPASPSVVIPDVDTPSGPGTVFSTQLNSGDVADTVISARRAEIKARIAETSDRMSALDNELGAVKERVLSAYLEDIMRGVRAVHAAFTGLYGKGTGDALSLTPRITSSSPILKAFSVGAHASKRVADAGDDTPTGAAAAFSQVPDLSKCLGREDDLSFSVHTYFVIELPSCRASKRGGAIALTGNKDTDAAVVEKAIRERARSGSAEDVARASQTVITDKLFVGEKVRKLITELRELTSRRDTVAKYSATLRAELGKLGDIREALVSEMTRRAVARTPNGGQLIEALDSLVSAKFALPKAPQALLGER